jgi:hypothetical protein
LAYHLLNPLSLRLKPAIDRSGLKLKLAYARFGGQRFRLMRR